MAVANPVTSSQPETQTPSSQPMSSVDIGLMVGSIVLFIVLITSIFIVRGLDGRRRVKGLLRRAEEGEAENQNEHQTFQETGITELTHPGPAQLRHKGFWQRGVQALRDCIERLKKKEDSLINVKIGQAKEDTSMDQVNPQMNSEDTK